MSTECNKNNPNKTWGKKRKMAKHIESPDKNTYKHN